MRKFISALICFALILVAGIVYATNTDVFTQQDKSKMECDQGVPCSVMAIEIPTLETIQIVESCKIAGMNIRDVNQGNSYIYIIKNSRSFVNKYCATDNIIVIQKKAKNNKSQKAQNIKLHINPGWQSI
jgi:hypothetical protein